MWALLGSRLPASTSDATRRDPNTGKKVGLPEVTLLHQKRDDFVGRHVPKGDLVIIVFDEPFKQRAERFFLRAEGRAGFDSLVQFLHHFDITVKLLASFDDFWQGLRQQLPILIGLIAVMAIWFPSPSGRIPCVGQSGFDVELAARERGVDNQAKAVLADVEYQ